jgi:predicted dehydrogenase
VDDFAAAFVRLEGDIILDFRISWAMHMDTAGDALILGTKGGLRFPSTECWNGSVGGPLKLYQQMGKRSVVTEFPVPAAAKEGNFYYKVRSFLDAVKNGTPAPVPASQILYNQIILDSIGKSAELGKEIAIEIPEI